VGEENSKEIKTYCCRIRWWSSGCLPARITWSGEKLK